MTSEQKTIALTVKERLLISQIYPEKSSLTEQTIVRDVSRKLELSQDEQKEIEFKTIPQGFTWNQEKEQVKVVEFTDAELNLLKDRVNALDKEQKITQQILELCLKIKNA
jgi:ribosomal protein L18E